MEKTITVNEQRLYDIYKLPSGNVLMIPKVA